MIFRDSGSRLGAGGGDSYPHPDFEGIKKREQKHIDIPRPQQIFGLSATTDFQGDREISKIGLLPLKRIKNFMNRRFFASVL